ncbi:hypothetical protein [Micropruina sp.]|uniref:hypothetical protein n=1 Tax=Micropruina sp. TaxID=2737536 RepID=UPI0039E37530
MQAETTAKRAGGWALFALVVAIALHFFGFIALAALGAVIVVALIRAGWSSSTPWVRAVYWIAAAAVLALPVLLFWEVIGGYQVLTVS